MSENSSNEDPMASLSYEEKLKFCTKISEPMANKKLTKRMLKLAKKARSAKQVRQGIKDIPKFITKKGEQGIVMIAGDITPIDVICHIPLVCEEHNIPYCYIPSKLDIGAACGSRRTIAMLLIKREDSYAKLYDKCAKAVSSLVLPIT